MVLASSDTRRFRGLSSVRLTRGVSKRSPDNMATLTIELPPHEAQTVFNLSRWAELLADRELARFEGRIETDRHGQIIMSLPPAPSHGSFQSEIAYLLRTYMPSGRTLTECPISTADGVKAADVAWASPDLPRAPEICVEVISLSNTEAEMREKMALYFDAGAREVWFCSTSGAMRFFGPGTARALNESALCPRFPLQLHLP